VVEIHENLQQEQGVITYSLDEYRAKLEEIILKENSKFRLLAEQQAKEIIDEARQKADSIIAQAQKKTSEYIGASEQKAAQIVGDSYKKAESIVNEQKLKALSEQEEILNRTRKDAADIMEKANQEAQRIITQAEENIKKEAKSRVKTEAEKIVSRAREESDSIIAEARKEAASIISSSKKEADQQAHDTIDRLKQEADSLIKTEIEKCSAETRARSSQIYTEAKNNAEKMINDIVNNSKHVHTLISGSITNADKIIGKAKDDLKTELGDLEKRITEMQTKLELITGGFAINKESPVHEKTVPENKKVKDSCWLVLKGEKSAAGIGENGIFKGEIELKALAPFNMERLKIIKKTFSQISSVKYLGEFSSEEGIQISYKLQDKLPIIEILKKTLTLESVEKEGDNLKLTFA
jgi:vacuolar-type H+-ATPase subunit H